MMAPGKVTERYEFREVLGEGGMGVVYRAFDRVVGREVAIKTIRDVQDKNSLELFRKECSVLASFGHPHIVEIFDFGELEETGARKPFFVMPLLDGLTLDKVIHSSTESLSPERCVDIISQVCRGLQAAHDRGLVHRDLKPSNIFVLPGDSVKIIDFGVAHLVDTQSSIGLKGTLLYMAPEQILMKKPSPLTDLFSVAVVCFEMLTRRRPFDGATREEIAEQIVRVIPPPASQFNPQISLAVSQVVHKAMAKQPYHRFTSVKEFGDALNKAFRNEPIESLKPERIEPRVLRAKKAFEQSELEFASEIVAELESEALLHPDIVDLRKQIDSATRQKNIQQLLETARRRFEEDEYQLALQKIQEVLNLEPANTEAHALKGDIETKRSSAQIDDWFKLSWEHMENHSYGQARKALQNVLQLRPKEQRAQQLLAEVDRREQDYLRIRREKEESYQAASDAFRRGDLSSALTKLERVLDMDRRAPDTFAPDRAAIYQKMYNDVRSEHDRLASVFSEVRQNLDSGNLAKALTMCQQALEKYPGHAMFQSLKLDIEVRQRQELSAFIAKIDREVDAEPDLNNKIRILEKAQQQDPAEVHFQQSLQTIRSKRDLVEAIVSQARNLEDRGQFAESLDKWEILQSIYPQYPALDFELERVRKRREAKDRQQAKAALVDRIDRCRQSGEFDRALALIADALQEFPGDAEILAVERAVRQGIERTGDSQRLVEQGRAEWQAGRHDEGLQLLRQANELDPASATARGALLEILISTARTRIDSNWQQAGELLQQVHELDPGNPMATSLQRLVNDKQEDEYVTNALSQSRERDAQGKIQEALELLEQACGLYPSNSRLSQFRAALKRRLPQAEREEVRRKDLEKFHQLEKEIVADAKPGDLQSIFQRTSVLAEEYPGDPDIQDMATKIRERVEKEALAKTVVAPTAAGKGAKPNVAVAAGPPIVDRLNALAQKGRVWGVAAWGRMHARVQAMSPEQTRIAWTLAAVTLLTAMSLVYVAFKKTPKEVTPIVAQTIPLSVKVEPINARVVVFDEAQKDVTSMVAALMPGRYVVRASLAGYKPGETTVVVGPPGPAAASLRLTAIPASLELGTSQDGLTVLLNGETLPDLGGGRFGVDPLPDGEHRLEVNSRLGTVSMAVAVKPATLPQVTEFSSKGLNGLAVVQFGNQSQAVRAEGPGTKVEVAFDSEPPEALGPEGAQRTFTDNVVHGVRFMVAGLPEQSVPVTLGSGPRVHLVIPGDQAGYLIVDAGSPDIRLTVNGRSVNTAPVPRSTARIVSLKVGDYTVRVERDGFEAAELKAVPVRQGDSTKRSVALKEIVTTATLLVLNAAGAEVSVDGQSQRANSERFSVTVPAGSHRVAIRRDGFEDWTQSRDFPKGQEIPIDGAQVLKKKITMAKVTFRPTPSNAKLVLRRQGAPQEIPIREGAAELPEGSYEVSASATDFQDRTEKFQVAPSQTAFLVDIALARRVVAEVKPKVEVNPMDGWPQSAGWRKQGDRYVRPKDDLILYGKGTGTFEFDMPCKKQVLNMGGCKAEILAAYNSGTYVSFVVTRKNIEKRIVAAQGQPAAREQKSHGLQFQNDMRLRATITPSRIQVFARVGGAWVPIGDHEDPSGALAKGKFGLREVNELISFSHIDR